MKQQPAYQLTDSPELLADLAFDALVSFKQYWQNNRVIQIHSRVPHHRRRLVVDAEGNVCTVNKIIAYCLVKEGVKWLKQFFGGDVPDAIKRYVNEGLSLTNNMSTYLVVERIVALSIEELCVNLKSRV